MTSRGKSEKTSNGDDFEVLEARDAAAKEAENMIRAIQKYIQQGSNGRQLAIGGVSGWVTGYLAMKIGKTVATAVGGSLILLQIASHKGYININWNKVNKDLEGASKKLAQSSSDPSIPQMLDKAADYLDEQAEKAGRILRKKKTAAKSWYHRVVYGRQDWDGSEAFYFGFLGGSVTGLLTGIIL